MKNYLNQIQPITQSANLVILVVAVLWLVVPVMSQGNSKESPILKDLSDAIGSLSELSKEKDTSFGTRTDIKVGSKLLNKQSIKKLQVASASLMSQAELKLNKHPAIQEVRLTSIGSELEIKKTVKRLQLTELNNELVERKLNPVPMKVVNLKLPVGLDTQRIFNAMDTNDNGELSQEEFKAGTKLPDADEHFNKKDAGNDGVLSFEEFKKLLKPKSSSTSEDD